MKRLSIPVAAVLAAAACGGSEEPGRLPAPSEPVTVTVSEAVATASSEAFPATLVARREAQVATRMSGTVREVRVDVGDRVGAGQVLVVLDAGDVHARIDAAAGAAELARRTFQRVRNLAADGAASLQELDEARARLDAAEGGLADARAQAGYATVTAPFTGVVVARSSDPGDLAVPGRPLLRLVDHGALKVQADLPGGRAGTVGVGDPVRVTLPGGETHTARVTRVAPAVTGGSRRFRVEAAFEPALLPGGALLPGAWARLEVPDAGASTWWIPADAVVRRGQLTGAYVVEDGELRLRWLRLGELRGDAVEVLAGPASTGPLSVVRRPAPALEDGLPVASATSEPWAVPGVAAVVTVADQPSSEVRP